MLVAYRTVKNQEDYREEGRHIIKVVIAEATAEVVFSALLLATEKKKYKV